MYCANLGDSRAILSRNGKAIDLSVDHKAKRPDEQDRVKKQGGYIVNGRVMGRLAVSRSFGDFDCKNIAISENSDDGEEEKSQGKKLVNFILCDPEIRVMEIDPTTDDFFILASDGLFDKYSSKDCVKLI